MGLVGRNGAGKTTLTRILAGEGLPASGQVTATGSVGYLPQDPRTGDPDVPVRERILSARGLDAVVRRLRDAEDEMGSDDPVVRERGMKRYERADAALARRWRVRRGGRGRADRGVARDRGPAHDPAVAHAVGRAAPPGGARPDPVLRRRDAPARRAHQPPRRRLGRVAARVPEGAQGRSGRDQPRHGPAGAGGDEGVPPRRQPPGDRRLQHGLVGVPLAARDRRAPSQARAPQRRAQGRRPARAGRQDAGQGDEGAGRAQHDAAGREAAERGRGRAPLGPRGPDQVPRAGALRPDPADGLGAVQVVRLARGVHRRRPRHRQGLARRHPRAERRGQDDACCGSWPGSTGRTPAS